MQFEWTKMQENGRILIPAEIRKAGNISPGDKLCISIDDEGNIKLQSKFNALRTAQEYFSGLKHKGESIVDEFIKERREEAGRE